MPDTARYKREKDDYLLDHNVVVTDVACAFDNPIAVNYGRPFTEGGTTRYHSIRFRTADTLVNLEVQSAGAHPNGFNKVDTTADTTLRAYFCPWRGDQTRGIQLGSTSDFCFTSPMNGCAVLVMGSSRAQPRIYHANYTQGGYNPLRPREVQAFKTAQKAFYVGLEADLVARYADEGVQRSSAFRPDFYERVDLIQGGYVIGVQSASVFGYRSSEGWSFYYHAIYGTTRDRLQRAGCPTWLTQAYKTQSAGSATIYASMTGEFWPRLGTEMIRF